MVWLVGSFPDIEVKFFGVCPRYLTGIKKRLLHPPSGGSGVARSHVCLRCAYCLREMRPDYLSLWARFCSIRAFRRATRWCPGLAMTVLPPGSCTQDVRATPFTTQQYKLELHQ